jgi:predicted nuclease of predicted toxin-antitoxin system
VVRLLFDEQLSEELLALLDDLFPDSLHVRILGAGGSGDQRVWQLAREHDCVLVTKDEDFHRLSVMQGVPPKVVWIRLGNCSTRDIAGLLRQHEQAIRSFVDDRDSGFLELGGFRRV